MRSLLQTKEFEGYGSSFDKIKVQLKPYFKTLLNKDNDKLLISNGDHFTHKIFYKLELNRSFLYNAYMKMKCT